jgi:recombination protein RecT
MAQMSLPRAASVLLLREAVPVSEGEPFEIYMLRRPERARFAPGAYAFPGGVVEEQDRALGAGLLAGPEGPRLAALHERMAGAGPFASPDEETTAAILACAARELFEEAGVLLVRHASGRPHDDPAAGIGPGLREGVVVGGSAARRAALRDSLLGGVIDFGSAIPRLRLSPDDFIYFSHWVTPERMRIRFDTHFFLATSPPDQEATHYAGEMAGGEWLTPREGLARYGRGEFPMLPVQVKHLERLAEFDSLGAILAFAREKSVPVVLPTMDPSGREAELPEEVAACW